MLSVQVYKETGLILFAHVT